MVFRCISVVFNDSDLIFMNLLLIHVSSFIKQFSLLSLLCRSFYVFQELIFCEMYELKTIFPTGNLHLIHYTLYNLLFVSVQVKSLQYITYAAVQSSPWFSYKFSLYSKRFRHTYLWLIPIPASTHRQPLSSVKKQIFLCFRTVRAF